MNTKRLVAAMLLLAMLVAASRAFAVPSGYTGQVFADSATKLSF